MSDFAAQAWPEPRVGSGLATAALVCAVGAAFAFAVAGMALVRNAPAGAPPVVAEAAPSPWLAIIKPVNIFSLEAPQFRQQTLVYTARRRESADTREDTLAYGDALGAAPMLRLALLRGAASAATPSLDDGLSRLAGQQGFAAVLGTRRGALTTRFGRFETATLRIPGRTGPCDGFHLALSAPTLAIDGIACGTARADLACLIDRLDLASAGEDSALVDLFASAELRRNPACSGMRLDPGVGHSARLDDNQATPLGKMRRSTGF